MTRPPALSRAVVDRAAHRRADEAWLTAAATDPATRVLVVDDRGRVLTDPDGPRLVLVGPEEAPVGEHWLLGEDQGTAYLAVAGPLPRRLGARPAGLREVGALLPDADAGLLVHALALAQWHAAHPYCARCGAPTRSARGGSVRVCETDGAEHFPRTDPAVIMLVTDGGDRCVLGRQPTWPPGRVSTLAGFVEPGESLEQAVAREVAEEVGLAVRDVTYCASQPWPFPASLMLAFTAVADHGPLTVDPDELEEAAWYSRADLLSGRVLLPSPVSVAHRLVTDWLGQEPPGRW